MEYLSGSFSVGRLAYDHDMRNTLKANVSPELSHHNVVLTDKLARFREYDSWSVDDMVNNYINNKMQPIIDEYNVGKKPSRQIKVPYTEYRMHNAKLADSPVMYEAVIQIGEAETLGKLWYEGQEVSLTDMMNIEGHQMPSRNYFLPEDENIKEAYTKAYKSILEQIQERFPHLDITYATIHFDEPEGTPHMHIGYIPFGEMQKGLPVQVSIGAALRNDGIERVSRAEAMEQGGYQITKMYNICRDEIVKPQTEQLVNDLKENWILEDDFEWKFKPVQSGKKHLNQDLFDQKRELEYKIEEIQGEITNKLLELENLDEDYTKKKNVLDKEIATRIEKANAYIADLRAKITQQQEILSNRTKTLESANLKLAEALDKKKELLPQVAELEARFEKGAKRLNAINEGLRPHNQWLHWYETQVEIDQIIMQSEELTQIFEANGIDIPAQYYKNEADILRSKDRVQKVLKEIEFNIPEIFAGLSQEGRGR